MSTYQPNIPTGTVNLDQDYNNLRSNFQALNTVFGVDHTSFDNATAQKGYHTVAHLIPVSTTATPPPDNNLPPKNTMSTPGFGQVLSAQVNDGYDTDEALFFLSGGNKLTQLTSNIVPSSNLNGYTSIPGGIIVQWGNGAIPAGQLNYNVLVNYNIPFATEVYSIYVTGSYIALARPTASFGLSALNVSLNKFEMSKSGSNLIRSFFWLAIGK